MSRILVLTAAQRLPDLSTLYAHMATRLALDIKHLDKAQQLDLRRTLADTQLSQYTRILVDLPFRHIYRQSAFFSGLSGVMFYEEDASQNYMRNSRRHGVFSRFYARVPAARVIVTGALLAVRLRREGVDAHFLGKGFDPSNLFTEHQPRDIELGFIGRVGSAEYAGRQRLLQQLAACEPLQLLRTTPGPAYRHMLNRIQLFVSADMGFGEYMAKNFEAMACGCLVLAWRQPDEERALGLCEGEHVLLYSSLEELREHIRQLRDEPQRLQRIANAGQQWVTTNRSYPALADQLSEHLLATWPVSQRSGQVARWRRLWPF